jgi:hypothetical protein
MATSGSGPSFVSGGDTFRVYFRQLSIRTAATVTPSSSFIRTRPLSLNSATLFASLRSTNFVELKYLTLSTNLPSSQLNGNQQQSAGRFCVLFSGPLTSSGGPIGRLKYSARNGRNLAKYSEHFPPISLN